MENLPLLKTLIEMAKFMPSELKDYEINYKVICPKEFYNSLQKETFNMKTLNTTLFSLKEEVDEMKENEDVLCSLFISGAGFFHFEKSEKDEFSIIKM